MLCYKLYQTKTIEYKDPTTSLDCFLIQIQLRKKNRKQTKLKNQNCKQIELEIYNLKLLFYVSYSLMGCQLNPKILGNFLSTTTQSKYPKTKSPVFYAVIPIHTQKFRSVKNTQNQKHQANNKF